MGRGATRMTGSGMMDEWRQKRGQPLTGRLERIDAALDRLDSGTYGFCETCLEPIAINMLEVDPTIHLCPACTLLN